LIRGSLDFVFEGRFRLQYLPIKIIIIQKPVIYPPDMEVQKTYPKCNPLFSLITHPSSADHENNVKSPWITKDGMI
jgi:hypothetical protein